MVLFNTVRCRDSDEFNFQRNSNSYRSPYRTDFSCLDIIIIPSVIRRRCSLHIFCQSKLGTHQDTRRVHASSSIISNLFFCFIANITATISSEVPSLGKGRHHILLLGELFPQISSFYMIFESTPHFFNCHMWMFPFWKHLIAFFRNKRWKVIGFTEGSIFFNVAHTYSYRSFVVFKQRTTSFFFF